MNIVRDFFIFLPLYKKLQAMRKSFHALITTLSVVIFSSCYSLEHVPVDYMVAADVSFPAQIKRVGIVNNVNSEYPDNIIMVADTVIKSPFELARKTTYFNGDPVITTEALAQAIAAQNYFDEVIICDSALRAHDIQPRETILSPAEVSNLTRKLDADIIVALENIQIKATRIVSVMPGYAYMGTIDAKIVPTVRLYLPNRSGPLLIVQPSDSICWENEHYSEARLRAEMISDEDIIKEASEYAGSIPTKHLIPYWQTVNRFMYAGGSPEMRDAAVFAKKNEWDKALELWQKVYAKKNQKKKMHAAYNITLYYELKDDLDKAEEYIKVALEIAKTSDKKESIMVGSEVQSVPVLLLYSYYAEEIQKRKLNVQKLNMQMERFKEEF